MPTCLGKTLLALQYLGHQFAVTQLIICIEQFGLLYFNFSPSLVSNGKTTACSIVCSLHAVHSVHSLNDRKLNRFKQQDGDKNTEQCRLLLTMTNCGALKQCSKKRNVVWTFSDPLSFRSRAVTLPLCCCCCSTDFCVAIYPARAERDFSGHSRSFLWPMQKLCCCDKCYVSRHLTARLRVRNCQTIPTK